MKKSIYQFGNKGILVTRHADGSRLYPMEQLNKLLTETLVSERTDKTQTKKKH